MSSKIVLYKSMFDQNVQIYLPRINI